MKIRATLISTLVLCLPSIGYAEDLSGDELDDAVRAKMTDIRDSEAEFHNMVDRTSEVYSAIVKGVHGEVPAQVLRNARCIAILPGVLSGAVVVGVTHGEGLASCKDNKGSWSQPAAISLNQATIGMQAGAKSTDFVLFFQTEESATAFKNSEIVIGTDVSAVVGTYDSEIDTSKAGMLVYSQTKGAFAGISLNGGTLRESTKNTESYYGKKVDYIALLEGREMPDESDYTNKLTSLFPQ